MVAPAGLGAREGVMQAVLAHAGMTPGDVLVLVVVTRVWVTALDVVPAGIVLLLRRAGVTPLLHDSLPMSISTLILPGLSNSGPEHWQSRWERLDPTCIRVQQDEWETPRCADWVAGLNAAVARLQGEAVLVAHSSSCALVAHWAAQANPEQLARVRGALLVAPSDPYGPQYPVGATGFGPVPRNRLPFPSVVVASTDDAYVTIECAHEYADAWGSRFVNLGAAGHINSASGLGEWAEGYALLGELRGNGAT